MDEHGGYCPFCGSDDNGMVMQHDGANDYAFIQCAKCYARGPMHVTGEVAIDLWNTRVSITRKKLKK